MSLAITARMDPPDVYEKLCTFLDDFEKTAQDTHRKWVFMVLEYIVKYSRVDTGRSRAAWTPMMVFHDYDFYRSMTITGSEDVAAEEEGRSQGLFTDDPFCTTITNNVVYVDPMNQQYGLFGFSESAGGPKNIKGVSVGDIKTKRMKMRERGIRFEEKMPMFEQMGEERFAAFMNVSKKAYESKRSFDPGNIPPLENPAPTGSE